MRRSLPFLALLLPACSTSSSSISIDITAGQETTAFVDSGATECSINVQSLDGTVNETVTAAPGQTFNLPTDIPNDEQIYVAVTCTAADGTQVMAGESLSGLLLSAVTSAIPIFVQRIDQWARPPGALVCSHLGGIATVEAERFLVLTGGTRAETDTSCDMSQDDGYDVFALGGTNTTANFLPASPTTPQTLVSLGSSMLAIVGDQASLIDLSGVNEPVVQMLPSGLKSFADVAGGAVVLGTTSSFVVGATRSTGSNMVLEVSSDGSTLTAYELSATRTGAAATWVQNANGGGFAGLVVAGGSATAPAVEVLGATATAFTTLPYAPIATTGASAVTDGSNGFFLFGGVDGTMAAQSWHMQTTCIPCNAVSLTTMGLPTLTGVSAYSFSTGSGLNELVVGTDATNGMTRTFTLDVSNLPTVPVTELLLKEPRKGATSIAAPNGTLTVMGGQHLNAMEFADGTPALSVEMFRPRYFAQSPVLSQ